MGSIRLEHRISAQTRNASCNVAKDGVGITPSESFHLDQGRDEVNLDENSGMEPSDEQEEEDEGPLLRHLTCPNVKLFVHQVIQDTANNESSMCQDMCARKQKTEIDCLNGCIVRMGKLHSAETLANEMLCKRISQLLSPL